MAMGIRMARDQSPKRECGGWRWWFKKEKGLIVCVYVGSGLRMIVDSVFQLVGFTK